LVSETRKVSRFMAILLFHDHRPMVSASQCN
jgi:hypothetical protein